jgi:hypothetical protein
MSDVMSRKMLWECNHGGFSCFGATRLIQTNSLTQQIFSMGLDIAVGFSYDGAYPSE